MYHLLTESELLNLLRSSDEAAFTEIYERYWEKMTMHVLKVIQSSDDARDIVQEVFISIWKRRGEIVISGALGAYLLKSVRNLSIRYIEKNTSKRNFLSSLSQMFNETAPAGQNDVEYEELEGKIAHAVSKLPPKMQEVFILSRREHLSYKEIAKQMGITETTVKKQVSNAIKIIRNAVNELFILFFIGLTILFH
ncbi:MAG: RNA polymerase sigma-70 factor [Sphingobacteriales bacterium]|nr:RNA polymerase sigma-70 factor [Sphingobacteriales bacterium]OJY91017.1 MAG: hypothetical protein BGP14_06380 [Sphingobacteriales bacterium 44-15]